MNTMNTIYPLGDYSSNYCATCGTYYQFGTMHFCPGPSTPYISSWATCPKCNVYYDQLAVHSCPEKVQRDTELACGCKLKVVIDEQCKLHEDHNKDE